ncbi:MAG: tRNA (guanine-N1)-methyltransferase [Chloroflexaceae bacterium]|nr:tRNA (guanine-N1)-methyltransferase [Chloroflexaceae bacterium]
MSAGIALSCEGKAQFYIGNAFYRPSSQVARDLGVLAAAVYKQKTGQLRILEAMAATGVRSLRYWLESGADFLWANDTNSELEPVLSQNLQSAIAAGIGKISFIEANRVFFDCYLRQDFYDLVDVDSFGSPAPYFSSALRAAKFGGLVYFTCTDGRTGTGHLPEHSLHCYGAFARWHPAGHEQALRLLIGRIKQEAAVLNLGVEPVFSLFAGETYRLMLQFVCETPLHSCNYGFLGYCHECGDYQKIPWRKLGRASCPHDGAALVLSGPLWLGSLHGVGWLQAMGQLAQDWGWAKRVKLLEIMALESELPPYFYPLGEIGRRAQGDIPKKAQLLSDLQAAGYRASPTHIQAQGIKTDASLATCLQMIQGRY